MKIKVIFGSVLTVLGIIGLIIAAVMFTQHGFKEGRLWISALIIGLIFFSGGMGLVRSSENSKQ